MPTGGGGCLPRKVKAACALGELGPLTLACTVTDEADLLPSYLSVMPEVGLLTVICEPAVPGACSTNAPPVSPCTVSAIGAAKSLGPTICAPEAS